jgi:hypothetical protein
MENSMPEVKGTTVDSAAASPAIPVMPSWLAKRMNVDECQREIEKAREAQRRMLRALLPPDLVLDGRPAEYGDRIEVVHSVRWVGRVAAGSARGPINGPSRPMGQTELENHFSRQIQSFLAAARIEEPGSADQRRK